MCLSCCCFIFFTLYILYCTLYILYCTLYILYCTVGGTASGFFSVERTGTVSCWGRVQDHSLTLLLFSTGTPDQVILPVWRTEWKTPSVEISECWLADIHSVSTCTCTCTCRLVSMMYMYTIIICTLLYNGVHQGFIS